jgi:lipoate-protein ligase A
MPDAPSLLILPYRRAPAAVQMALDASLLAWAAAGLDRAAFRAYGWARPTLSLGRAEPFPEGWDEEAIARAGIDVVRRPTGGDAVLHDTELTFSIAASLPGPWGQRPRGFADLVADALARALGAAGLRAERVTPVGAGPAASGDRPGLHPCFARTAPGEVRVGPYKVAGIASRFTRGAALSHASVPLSGAFRDVARFRSAGAGDECEALRDGARAASELLAGGISEERVAAALGPELARGLAALPLVAAFPDLGLTDPAAANASQQGGPLGEPCGAAARPGTPR